MPLFMMISGYFSYSSYNKPTIASIKKRSTVLLLPVITFGLIIGVYELIILRHSSDFNPTYILLRNLDTWLWFLKSAFICWLLSLCLLKIFHVSRSVGITMALITGALIMNIQYANLNVMFPSFTIGIYLRHLNLFYQLECNKYAKTIFIVLLFISILSIYTYFKLDFNEALVKILTGCTISIFLLSSFILLRKWIFRFKLSHTIAMIGTITLELYVVQCFVVEILGKYFLQPFHTDSDLSGYLKMCLLSIFMTIFAEILCFYIVKSINVNKIARFIMFGKSMNSFTPLG